jgi:hypothetical protein
MVKRFGHFPGEPLGFEAGLQVTGSKVYAYGNGIHNLGEGAGGEVASALRNAKD